METSERVGKPPASIGIRVFRTVFLDLALTGAALLVFAYFHHVRVKEVTPTRLTANAAQTFPSQAFASFATPAAVQGEPEGSAQIPKEPDNPEQAKTEGQGAVAASGTEPGTGTVPDTEEPGEEQGIYSSDGKHAYEKFYQSENVSVAVTKHHTDNTVYFVADIHIRDLSSFRCAVALDYKEYNDAARKNVMQVSQLAGLTNAIVAISGDNFVFRESGRLAVRDGLEWERQLPVEDDLCVLFADGSMETFGKWAINRYTIEELYARNPYQVWCFGPMLLDENGEAMHVFNSSVQKVNPRSAIGYYEPGHYCFVLVDGRQKGYSIGLTLEQLSQVFHDLGCRVAYNLDGGDTVAMTFGTEIINHPEVETPRSVSDIVYICEPEPAAAPEGEG